MKHTKGEWKIVKNKMSTSIKCNDKSICILTSGLSEVNKANGKLMVAAQNMLEVCESIEEVYAELMASDSPKLPIEKFEYLSKLMSNSRAAIKKATE